MEKQTNKQTINQLVDHEAEKKVNLIPRKHVLIILVVHVQILCVPYPIVPVTNRDSKWALE
jgi:hypothetical protein